MSDRVMMTEDSVNLSVRNFLAAEGWVNLTSLTGNQKGIDVTGAHPRNGTVVQVESKGGTSGRPGSRRFGVGFDSAQIRVHVAEAVFTALGLREQDPRNVVLIALPDDDAHLSRVATIQATLRGLDIGLLAVSSTGVRVVQGTTAPARTTE